VYLSIVFNSTEEFLSIYHTLRPGDKLLMTAMPAFQLCNSLKCERLAIYLSCANIVYH
jgi:hypothetical protein